MLTYLPPCLPACLPASLTTYFKLPYLFTKPISTCLPTYPTYLTTYLRMQVCTYIGKYPSMNACMPIYGDKHVTVSEIHMLHIHTYMYIHIPTPSNPARQPTQFPRCTQASAIKCFVKVIAQLQLCRKGHLPHALLIQPEQACAIHTRATVCDSGNISPEPPPNRTSTSMQQHQQVPAAGHNPSARSEAAQFEVGEHGGRQRPETIRFIA